MSILPNEAMCILTKEQFDEVTKVSPVTMEIGDFDPVLLKEFVDLVLKVRVKEDVTLVAVEPNKYIPEATSGALIAIIKSSPPQYVGVMGLKK